MMAKQIRVAPAHWGDNDLRQHGWLTDKEYTGDAAQEYVTLNQANLDYPDKVEVKTLEVTDGVEVIRVFKAEKVPAYCVREVTPNLV